MHFGNKKPLQSRVQRRSGCHLTCQMCFCLPHVSSSLLFTTKACGLQVVFSSLKVAMVKIWTVDDMWWYTLIQTRRYTGAWGMESHLPCASRASRITSSRLRWLESSTGDGSQSLTYDSETMLSCTFFPASARTLENPCPLNRPSSFTQVWHSTRSPGKTP